MQTTTSNHAPTNLEVRSDVYVADDDRDFPFGELGRRSNTRKLQEDRGVNSSCRKDDFLRRQRLVGGS